MQQQRNRDRRDTRVPRDPLATGTAWPAPVHPVAPVGSCSLLPRRPCGWDEAAPFFWHFVAFFFFFLIVPDFKELLLFTDFW